MQVGKKVEAKMEWEADRKLEARKEMQVERE